MSVFHFKYFSIQQSRSALKVGTDSMVLGSLINCENKKIGLDIGCGTGVLSLMIAQKNKSISIDAIELDNESSKDCYDNFSNSDWNTRLNLIEGDYLEYKSDKKYDLIFSNPPFFENSQENKNENKTMARHTKTLPFSDLFEKTSKLLTSDGSFWIILPILHANNITEIASQNGLNVKESWKIEGKPNQVVRIVLHFQYRSHFNETGIVSNVFIIRNSDGSYSEHYKNLTKEFHNREL